MKRILFTGLAVIFSVAAIAQEQELSKSEQRQLQKQLKKEQQQEELAQKAALVALMVEHHAFVLEADRLISKRGDVVNVPSNLNFVAADSVNGVIQIGSYSYVGMNGVGGITVDGNLANYSYTRNEKNGTYAVSYNVRSSVGNYDVRMTVFPDTRAEATVSSNWPGRVSYSGYLVPPFSSRVWKGTTRF
jgi:hypothetical protein